MSHTKPPFPIGTIVLTPLNRLATVKSIDKDGRCNLLYVGMRPEDREGACTAKTGTPEAAAMRDQRARLSEHEYTRDVRLPNWGFWGRYDSCKPDPERGSSSIYAMGKQDETERDEDAAPEYAVKVDHADAEEIDGWIQQLGALHKAIIRDKFYKRRQINIQDTDAAVRALLDLMADNRKVVNLFKRLGWT